MKVRLNSHTQRRPCLAVSKRTAERTKLPPRLQRLIVYYRSPRALPTGFALGYVETPLRGSSASRLKSSILPTATSPRRRFAHSPFRYSRASLRRVRALLLPVDLIVEDFQIFLDDVGIQMLVLQAQVTGLEAALRL